MISLRPYQIEARDAILAYWAAGGQNPLVDLATGTGKSLLIASLIQTLLGDYQDMRVLVVAHVPELLIQNAQELLKAWPGAPLGIYCSKLGRKDIYRAVVFASIQSLHRLTADQLGAFDLVLVDEAHLIPANGEGMYLRLFEKLRQKRIDMRVAGFTATAFRMDSGRIDEGEGRIFDKTVYTYSIRQGIEDGYLSPLVSKNALSEIDVSKVAIRGGEFNPSALESAMDKDPLTRAAVAELAELGRDRKSWLIFCAGVKHAIHVRDAIRDLDIRCETITGDTPNHQRNAWLADFKAGRLRSLTSVNVLTTGSNLPCTDLVALLRGMISTNLYVQTVGRGTRLADGKANCLVLDFAGNVRRHGPVDTVEVETKKGGKAKDDAAVKEETVRAKECPTCHSLAPINAAECRDCGHQWPVEVKPKHDRTADAETPILSNEDALSRKAKAMLPDEHPVISWSASRHLKTGAPDSLKVTYLAGLQTFSEWVCLEHVGYPLGKAERWWRQHSGADWPFAPKTITDALERFPALARPEVIMTRKNGQFWEIVGRRFADEKQEVAA
jgi:DNA repair protein RadD